MPPRSSAIFDLGFSRNPYCDNVRWNYFDGAKGCALGEKSEGAGYSKKPPTSRWRFLFFKNTAQRANGSPIAAHAMDATAGGRGAGAQEEPRIWS
jgi:hypothetical protein